MADHHKHAAAIAAHRRQAAAFEAGRLAARQTAAAGRGCSMLPGTRVLDIISGEEGVIIGGCIQHTIIPIASSANGGSADGQAGIGRGGGAGSSGSGGAALTPGDSA